ncbi:protein LONGIFOLIA 1-like [Bidens hawaiensis]|uniref:protein LONGIFOLIA 1-like n=1 Tax=Bidens hawaiensis TaxID=980011 RepID=UPI00404B2B45
MSRSSSFSSLDCNINKTSHPEADRIMFPKTPSRDSSTRQSRQSVDLRDVVKDSMYRYVVDYNEPRELSRSKSYQLRDGSVLSVPKDCPRLSYDGRETNRSRKVISETQSLRSPEGDDAIFASRGPSQSRAPSVVAKLMGLEPLPDSLLSGLKESGFRARQHATAVFGPIKTHNSSSANQKESGFQANQNATDVFEPIKTHKSLSANQELGFRARQNATDGFGPLKTHNCDMKPIPKFPIEPAPWKQRAGVGPVYQAMKSTTELQSPLPSVYSEVDKRLKDLEFTESGKDLRALKQILEAMQLIETRKERTRPVSVHNERFLDCQNRGGSNSFRAYESSIVIIRPPKVVERSTRPVNEFSIGDRKIFRNNVVRSTREENMIDQTEVKGGGKYTRKTPGLTKENATFSGKRSGTVSPKKPELERRSQPPTPPVDSVKVRKRSVKPCSESSSSGRKSNYGQHLEIKGESKGLSYRKSQQSHEVVNVPEFSEETDNMQSPISTKEKSTLLDPEYPSPVSVLDDGMYADGSPSPVKHKLKTLQDDDPDDVIPDTISSGITSEVNRKKLQDIEHLVQKLTRLNSGHNESDTDRIASICENTKPDGMYISEILLASGLLLRDLTTFQFHSSGHPINPELFYVLEQTKFSSSAKQVRREKTHRKLVFDSVNEILERKLGLSVPIQKSFKVVKRAFNAQRLLRDLCLEVEELQVNKKKEDASLEEEDDELNSVLWEEVLNRAESWTDYDCEIPVITLDVERLIFKDLVSEVVLGEAVDGRRIKPGRRCRRLFSK